MRTAALASAVFLLPWTALAATVEVKTRAAELPAPIALAALAGGLQSALWTLPPPAVLPETGRIPSALDPVKPTILVERLRAAGLGARADAEGPAAPALLLRDANAVLQDFTPEKLRELPLEDIHRLAALIMAQREGPGRGADPVETAALVSGRRAADILARAGVPEEAYKPYSYANDGHELPVYDPSVPREVRAVSSPRPMFRQYTSEKGLSEILRTGALRNGVLPFIRRDHGVTQTFYERLTGAFLTLPGIPGRQVGVREENARWVDLAVPESVPVLEVRRGDIFMVPLPGLPEAWVEELYWRWVGGEKGMLSYLATLPRVELRGGPGPDIRVPVEILGVGP